MHYMIVFNSNKAAKTSHPFGLMRDNFFQQRLVWYLIEEDRIRIWCLIFRFLQNTICMMPISDMDNVNFDKRHLYNYLYAILFNSRKWKKNTVTLTVWVMGAFLRSVAILLIYRWLVKNNCFKTAWLSRCECKK